ncbi:hypothetical protein A6D94_04920 [Vibrio splendidus]|nr:hypothetical protein A6D94_04920 [Vibrio splendidus]
MDKNPVVTRNSNGDPLSYKYSDEWDFIGEKDVALNKATKVSFSYIKNLEHRREIQDTVYKIKMMWKSSSVGGLVSEVTRLHQISLALEDTNWSKLSSESTWRIFKNKFKGRYSFGTMEGYASTLSKLARLGYFTRKISYSEVVNLARTDGDTEQHIAIPSQFYQKILSKCINTVETYHPYRHEISKAMAEAFEIKSKALNGELFTYRKTNEISTNSARRKAHEVIKNQVDCDIPNFKIDFSGNWISCIMIECLMVCALFSGARLSELLSFCKDSYTVKKTINGDISVIQGKITKNNDGIERTETWQTHPIVKDALELAHDMVEFARTIYRNHIDKSFESGFISEDERNRQFRMIELSFLSSRINDGIRSNYMMSAPSAKTNNFLKRLGLEATISDVDEFDLLNDTRLGQLELGETLPKLSPHDFRRSFAVFMKRHGLGNAQTIKFQYKHTNIEMSEYYTNNALLAHLSDVLVDDELFKTLEEEEIRMGVDAYDEIYNKSKHLSGVEGERVLNDKFERVKSGQRVFMNRSEIEKLVRNGSLSIVMLPTGGYCTNSKCERLCGIKEFIAEKNVCQYQVVTDSAAKKQGKHRDRLIKKFQMLNNGDETRNLILSGLKQSILLVEHTLDKHKIPYKPFTDKIEGCYVS